MSNLVHHLKLVEHFISATRFLITFLLHFFRKVTELPYNIIQVYNVVLTRLPIRSNRGPQTRRHTSACCCQDACKDRKRSVRDNTRTSQETNQNFTRFHKKSCSLNESLYLARLATKLQIFFGDQLPYKILGPTLSGVSVAPTSEIRTIVMLVLLVMGN